MKLESPMCYRAAFRNGFSTHGKASCGGELPTLSGCPGRVSAIPPPDPKFMTFLELLNVTA